MTTIAYIILKFESMIKKPIVANHTLFTSITFSKINFFCLYQFYCNTTFIMSDLHQFQKDYHEDDLSFACP